MLNRRHPIDIIQAIPKRYKESHKGTYGRLLIIAGSRRYTGAATLMVEAALRAGVGMVTVVATHDTAQVIRIRAPEAIVVEAPESNGGFDKAAISTIRECAHDMNVTAVGIGPGLGALKSATDFYDGIDELIRECTWPVLIDADAMAPLYERCVRQPLDDHRLVFTPHPKEFLTMVNQTELKKKIEMCWSRARPFDKPLYIKQMAALSAQAMAYGSPRQEMKGWLRRGLAMCYLA